MKPLPFPEYRPDLSDLNKGYSSQIFNAKPQADGYGPIRDLAPFSEALGEPCRGAFSAYDLTDGTVRLFAATATDLYLLSSVDFTWTNVSQGGGPYPAIVADADWCFDQHGNKVLAIHTGVDMQEIDLATPTAFSDVGGSPPRAARLRVIGDFVFLAGLTDDPTRVQWGGIGVVDVWDGTQSSGFQDMPSGGAVITVEGTDFAVVIQEDALSRMTFSPGDPLIFRRTDIARGVGTRLAAGCVNASGTVYIPSTKGFGRVGPDGSWVLIGKERVDRTFFGDANGLSAFDEGERRLVIGVAVPGQTVVLWAYKSRVGGTSGVCDKVLAFDYGSPAGRWFPHAITAQYIAAMAQPGISLDAMLFAIDDLEVSLDSFSSASLPKLAAIDVNGRLGFFAGPNLEALLGTAEQSGIIGRVICLGMHPLTDADEVFGAVSGRGTLQAPAVWQAEDARNGEGFIPANFSTRHIRARLRIPAGTAWTYATGVLPMLSPDGEF